MEEVWHKRNVAAIDEIFAPEYVGHSLAHSGQTENIESSKESSEYFLSAFSDFRVTCDDVFAEEDRVALRFTVRTTHTGEFSGIAPTGRQVTFAGISVMRCQDGKIAEQWQIVDIPGLMKQLSDGAPLGESQE